MNIQGGDIGMDIFKVFIDEVRSIANKNAEFKVLRVQKYEEYRFIDTEIKMNETVMNQLEE